jgi:hypothetical protein
MGSLLRLVAIVASLLVIVGFMAFASDEAGRGSAQQVGKIDNQIAQPAPTAQGERARERAHGTVREKIDDANDILLAPFTGVVDSKDRWVQHLVPSGLALLAYGLGLMLVANYLPKSKPKRPQSDWRTAEG